jgi:hypothetical protein
MVQECKALPALGRSDHDTVLIDLALTAHQQRSSPRTILCSMYSPSVLLGGL